MSTSLSIRVIEVVDLPAVAAIHLDAFPTSALTKLGPDAVRRYYQWQLEGPHEVTALAALTDGRLAGFCFGGVFQGAMAGFLRKNRLFLMWRVVTHPWLLFNSLFRDRVGVAIHSARMQMHRAKRASGQKQRPAKRFGILSIGVDPAFQGMGVGTALMARAEDVARHNGFDAMDLTVDPENLQAVNFYTRLGWTKVVTAERWTGLMRKLNLAQVDSHVS
jgi:ribosomal protein S18 acetylase RimI-like enzyme